MRVGKWEILHHWALGKLNSMGSWCTKLFDYMGGWCRRKLNSMGGWVKKSAVFIYSKTCVKRPLSKRQEIGFQDQLSLMQVKSISECSKGSNELHSAILLTFIKLPFVI